MKGRREISKDQIKRYYLLGLSNEEIGLLTGRSASAVKILVWREGWKREPVQKTALTQLVKKYMDKKYSIRQTAKELGVSYSTVYRHKRKLKST
ncbi:helix-turn-helix domain-containing protein [Rapidithrix thailandica]|uniref:Helix-turn-helix domain-containing protein n=1 Tax=Rapidithrix thailandica TaxID=413964 RepID=A0AAW9RV33_9BACT